MICLRLPCGRSRKTEVELVSIAMRCCSLRLLLLGTVILAVNGCSSSSATAPAPPPQPQVMEPSIATQPADQSVPMGVSASFSVVATGSSLQYQWQKNAANIPGATANSYTIQAATPADNGSTFTVIVSNTGGS